jgi:oxygen-independent coproporphyrinogen-3 oxidase
MPDGTARLRIALESRAALLTAGYEPIGMDHFALPGDELSRAKRAGTLHRNFQGYCTAERAGQVHAVGASGISQLHAGYLQNIKDLPTYLAAIGEGRLPFESGYRLTPRDRGIRSIINGLLCRGEADLKAALREPGLDSTWVASYLEAAEAKLRVFEEDGLVEVTGSVDSRTI